VLVPVIFSQLLLVKVYEEEGDAAQQDAGGAETEYIFCIDYVNFLMWLLIGGA
jgi:hypothetical protein